ncbi:MAG: hypothetical protein JST00_24355 [Deltaproteobacteria bacterium]|nr:hypothetical protein [Deltaproteobacteria bacterium]
MPEGKKTGGPKPNHLVARKLLVAAVGVATVNYVAMTGCGGKEETSSSSSSSGQPPTSGNLPAPPATTPPTSGNLPAPPPRPDAAADADADADAADADPDADDGG